MSETLKVIQHEWIAVVTLGVTAISAGFQAYISIVNRLDADNSKAKAEAERFEAELRRRCQDPSSGANETLARECLIQEIRDVANGYNATVMEE